MPRRIRRSIARKTRCRCGATRSMPSRPRSSRKKRSAPASLLIHYSTDYVFDGDSDTPYDEDAATRRSTSTDAASSPGNRRSWRPARAALVLRTSWVYGLRGSNFLLTMRRLAATPRRVENRRRPVRRAELDAHTRRGDRHDRRARPGVARGTRGPVSSELPGQASWYEFASAIIGAVANARAWSRSPPRNIRLRRAGRAIRCSTRAGSSAPSALHCPIGTPGSTRACAAKR